MRQTSLNHSNHTITRSSRLVLKLTQYSVTRLLLLMVGISSLAATGCIGPTQQITYYEPLASEAVQVTASSGPANQAKFNLPGHDLTLTVIVQPSYTPARIWMSVELAKGQNMLLASDHYAIVSADLPEPRKVVVTSIRGTTLVNDENITRNYPIDQELQGVSVATVTHLLGRATTQPRLFEIIALLNDPLPEQFELQLPELHINGKAVDLPTLSFTRQTGQFRISRKIEHNLW